MNDLPYFIVEPTVPRVPFLLSLPHCGIGFPDEVKDEFNPSLAAAPDDTDWFLDRLYDFAASLGVTTIVPKYSRWVIDLNREPSSKPLYDDGRIITAICPATDFHDTPIYLDGRTEIDQTEVSRRLENYFIPYHVKIDELCSGLLESFDNIIFWDGHSIRRRVPTIQKEPFPDFILGNNNKMTASDHLIGTTLNSLKSKDWDVTHNRPFKGGYLTRSKGRPENGINALQLEMSKDLYMTEDETIYSSEKAAPVKEHLKHVFKALIHELLNVA